MRNITRAEWVAEIDRLAIEAQPPPHLSKMLNRKEVRDKYANALQPHEPHDFSQCPKLNE